MLPLWLTISEGVMCRCVKKNKANPEGLEFDDFELPSTVEWMIGFHLVDFFMLSTSSFFFGFVFIPYLRWRMH